MDASKKEGSNVPSMLCASRAFNRLPLSFLYSFEQRGDALAATNAHADDSIAAAAALQFISGFNRENRAGGSDGVAQRDAGAIRVDLGRIELEVAHAGQRLGGEGFVQL